ncbi:MAG TPA: phytanoyl-CoA dioxygenase family protein [Labilithrix sp.]|nr:phytanoyl-CoA dioxygenase family protein [Labilithrix sp.]
MIDDARIEEAIAHYRLHGWARLGVLADEATLAPLRERADRIMMGEVTYEGLFFQHDSETGKYEDLSYGQGWKGPSLAYRKVEKLEKDPLFWEWLSNDVFRRIAARVYGAGGATLYRAFLMNKHAGGGSNLPWHQDGGNFWGLDRDPVLQIWTPLDDAPLDGGCLEVVPGSHLAGLATPLGGVVPADHVERGDASSRTLAVPTVAGEVILLHNHVWHRSGRTSTGKPRRALSVCYMDAATRCRRRKRAPRSFVRVW